MARIVDALETEYAAVLRRRRHPLLGRATVNVGSIRGGRQPNIVPDSCMITVDRRILPGETDDDTIQEIETLFRRRKVRAEIGRTHKGTCGPLETDPRLPLVRQFFRAVGQKTPAGVDFFSDGGILSAGGIPAVLFGPGDIAQAHTPDEWIESKQLERGKTLLLRFLQSLT
jgi:acetylornithine deacetylase/succinyl-diaminopimelate desuccinylase-like protein